MPLLDLKHAIELIKRSSATTKIEIEIGCGNGHFLTSYAEKHNRSLILGIEQKEKRCMKALNKIEAKSIRNAYIIHAKAEALIASIHSESIDVIHAYFPDPWPKSRHRKRRFFRMAILDQLFRILKPDGKIFLTTDFFDYFIQIKVLFALHDGFKITDKTVPEEVFTSIYGTKFTSANKKIHSLVITRCK